MVTSAAVLPARGRRRLGATMQAPAFVASSCGRYLRLSRKVRWRGPASTSGRTSVSAARCGSAPAGPSQPVAAGDLASVKGPALAKNPDAPSALPCGCASRLAASGMLSRERRLRSHWPGPAVAMPAPSQRRATDDQNFVRRRSGRTAPCRSFSFVSAMAKSMRSGPSGEFHRMLAPTDERMLASSASMKSAVYPVVPSIDALGQIVGAEQRARIDEEAPLRPRSSGMNGNGKRTSPSRPRTSCRRARRPYASRADRSRRVEAADGLAATEEHVDQANVVAAPAQDMAADQRVRRSVIFSVIG